MQYKKIESRDNQLVKRVVRLARERKYRQTEKQAVIYGEHLVNEALQYGLLSELILLESALDNYPQFSELPLSQIHLVDELVMKKMNLLDSSVDMVGVISLPEQPASQAEFSGDWVVIENIQDPGNLGTILRATKASGIKQVFLSSASVDIYNPKVLRASQGIQFGLTIISDGAIEDFLKTYTGNILAFTPHGDNSLYQQNLATESALIFGNEGAGLSSAILNKCANQVTIPMRGSAESLNLAMAVTIAVFEMSRQRISHA